MVVAFSEGAAQTGVAFPPGSSCSLSVVQQQCKVSLVLMPSVGGSWLGLRVSVVLHLLFVRYGVMELIPGCVLGTLL